MAAGMMTSGRSHSVTVSDFKLGKYEVTFAQWDACLADGGCGGYTPDDEGRGNRPVIYVSWDDIQLFIDWLNARTGGNYRLPTEAEWEYAARAGSTTKYSWGNSIGHNRANCDGCGSRWDDDRTAPVGSFSANAWGIHDMHGNVWEWVQDCSNDSYVGAPTDGSAWTSGDCGRRVIRGGSWFHLPGLLRSANRTGSARSNSGLPYRLPSGPGQVDRRHYTKQSAQVFLPGFPLNYSLFPFSARRCAPGPVLLFNRYQNYCLYQGYLPKYEQSVLEVVREDHHTRRQASPRAVFSGALKICQI